MTEDMIQLVGLPRLNEPAPKFEAETTHGVLRLEDYEGSWLIDALQTSDSHQVATPANWTPGEKVIVPPPRTAELAEERAMGDYECVDWYICKKELI